MSEGYATNLKRGFRIIVGTELEYKHSLKERRLRSSYSVHRGLSTTPVTRTEQKCLTVRNKLETWFENNRWEQSGRRKF